MKVTESEGFGEQDETWREEKIKNTKNGMGIPGYSPHPALCPEPLHKDVMTRKVCNSMPWELSTIIFRALKPTAAWYSSSLLLSRFPFLIIFSRPKRLSQSPSSFLKLEYSSLLFQPLGSSLLHQQGPWVPLLPARLACPSSPPNIPSKAPSYHRAPPARPLVLTLLLQQGPWLPLSLLH